PAATPGVFAPARIAGGVGTWMFHQRQLQLRKQWVGFLSDEELAQSRKTRAIMLGDLNKAPRAGLWMAKVTEEETFFGPKRVYADFKPLPEAPEFLQGGFLTDGNHQNQPLLLFQPDSLLVLHWDRLGDEGRLKLSRLAGPAGKVLWTSDLPMRRLEAVMPGKTTIALLGYREEPDPMRPRDKSLTDVDQLSVIDLVTGRTTSYGFMVKATDPEDIPASSTK
ncbi:MAG TPA: hypothetical protein VIO94_02415, partial [Phenylobacterium sp.]